MDKNPPGELIKAGLMKRPEIQRFWGCRFGGGPGNLHLKQAVQDED